jgi:hypothetical protein
MGAYFEEDDDDDDNDDDEFINRLQEVPRIQFLTFKVFIYEYIYIYGSY